MVSTLLFDVRRFLATLRVVQDDLLALFEQKTRALTNAGDGRLVELSEQEAELARRLQGLVAYRKNLLERARSAGIAADTLAGLVRHVAEADAAPLLRDIEVAEVKSARLRHESWIHWIISHRCYNHYTELLDLIAHGGHVSPVYTERNHTAAHAVGGSFLDASV